jgi:hypothetical protein
MSRRSKRRAGALPLTQADVDAATARGEDQVALLLRRIIDDAIRDPSTAPDAIRLFTSVNLEAVNAAVASALQEQRAAHEQRLAMLQQPVAHISAPAIVAPLRDALLQGLEALVQAAAERHPDVPAMCVALADACRDSAGDYVLRAFLAGSDSKPTRAAPQRGTTH